MSNTPLINGIRHSWGSIKANLLGRTVTGFDAVSYEEKQEKKNNYGAGNRPVSRGRGRVESSAKITLHAYEVDAIQAQLPKGKTLFDVEPFDVVVAYMPEGSDGLITHVLRNAEFTSNKRDVKEGDTVIKVEFELIISNIEWN